MRGVFHIAITIVVAILLLHTFPSMLHILAPSFEKEFELVLMLLFIVVAAIESRAPDSDLVVSTSPIAKLAYKLALLIRVVKRGHRKEFHGLRGLAVYAGIWAVLAYVPLALGYRLVHELVRLAAVAGCIAFAEHVLQDTVTVRGVGRFRGFAIESHTDDEVALGMIFAGLGATLLSLALLPSDLQSFTIWEIEIRIPYLLGLLALHAVPPWCWSKRTKYVQKRS